MLNIDMQKQSKLRSQKAKINCQHILHAANAKAVAPSSPAAVSPPSPAPLTTQHDSGFDFGLYTLHPAQKYLNRVV